MRGNDTYHDTSESDLAWGHGGDDHMDSGWDRNPDFFSGGRGDDTLLAGPGSVGNGGAGDDSLLRNTTALGKKGNDEITLSTPYLHAKGGQGNDLFSKDEFSRGESAFLVGGKGADYFDFSFPERGEPTLVIFDGSVRTSDGVADVIEVNENGENDTVYLGPEDKDSLVADPYDRIVERDTGGNVTFDGYYKDYK